MANNRIQVKRTTVAGRTPNTTNAANTQYIYPGELGLNMTDQILYTSDGTNLISVGANQVNLNVTNTLTVNAINANGLIGSLGQYLTSDGTKVYWSSPGAASVNVQAQYTWTNTQTFTNTITFSTFLLANAVNAASYTIGSSFSANSTLVNAAAIDIRGLTNTVTLYVSTSANVGANVRANTTAILIGNSTQNVIATSTQVITNSVFYYISNSATFANTSESSTFYDSVNHALTVYADDTSTPLVVGQQKLLRVVNKSGSAIPQGTPVYLTGAQGNRPTIAPAISNSTGYDVVGLVSSSSGIANNAEGFVIISGLLSGVNTTGYTAGALLYLGNTAGTITQTQPSFPDYQCIIGQALNSTNNGKIFVLPQTNYLAPAPNTAILLWDSKNQVYSNSFTFDYANNVLLVGNSTINTSIGLVNGAGLYSYIQVFGNSNTSIEESMVNSNTGNNVSADYIAYDNFGINSNNYIDVGINGSNFNQATWTINGPSDGYIYTSNTNLSIGAASSTNYINFFTGNTLITNERMRITNTAITVNTGLYINSPAINITNQTNTGTLYVATSVNVGSATVANATGVYTTGTMNAASHTVGTSFIANTTQITISGIPLNANNSNGNPTQVLTSNGSTGSPYWSTVSASPGGSNTYIQFNDSGSFNGIANLTFNKTTSVLSVSNTVTVGNSTVNTVHSSTGITFTDGSVLNTMGQVVALYNNLAMA